MGDGLDEMIKNLRNQNQSKASDFVHIFEYFVSKEGIRGKTRITKAQRNMLYVYGIMHKKHPTWGLNNAAEDLAVLLISEEGPDNSRKGMIELFRGLLSQMRDESVNLDVSKPGQQPKP